MSIIFDALKRAEAQRQKGQAPKLAATRTASHAHSRVRLWALASLFVVLGISAWWFRGMPTKPSAMIAASEVAKPDAASPELIVSPEKLTTVESAPQADLGLKEAPAVVPAAVIATDLSATDVGASRATQLSVPSLDAPLTGAAQFDERPEQVVVSPPPVAPPAATKPVEPIAVQPAVTPELASSKPAEATVQAAPVAAVPAVTPSAVAPEPTLPSIFELEYKVRHELPKMAVSMYVYNAQQQFRFVIISGKRYAEGEQIESKVSITKIRADGLECEFQGTRFFYPRQSL